MWLPKRHVCSAPSARPVRQCRGIRSIVVVALHGPRENVGSHTTASIDPYTGKPPDSKRFVCWQAVGRHVSLVNPTGRALAAPLETDAQRAADAELQAMRKSAVAATVDRVIAATSSIFWMAVVLEAGAQSHWDGEGEIGIVQQDHCGHSRQWQADSLHRLDRGSADRLSDRRGAGEWNSHDFRVRGEFIADLLASAATNVFQTWCSEPGWCNL